MADVGSEEAAVRMLRVMGREWYVGGLAAYREYVMARNDEGRVFTFSKDEIAAIVAFEVWGVGVRDAERVLREAGSLLADD